jgi:hypothetical protein
MKIDEILKKTYGVPQAGTPYAGCNTINLKPTSMEAIQKIAANDNEWRVVA